jgi:hypothetical protein
MAGSEDPAVFVLGSLAANHAAAGGQGLPGVRRHGGRGCLEQNAGRIVAQILPLRADGGLVSESLLPTLDEFVCGAQRAFWNRRDSVLHGSATSQRAPFRRDASSQ